MKDFRKWFPALAVVALTIGAASTANAQNAPALTCTSNAGVPPIVRSEGLTELVGDLVLNCTGGVPTALNAPVPQANIQIFLNTNITSRLLNDPWSEALLMIDEPANGNQSVCTTAGGCAATGVNTGSPVTSVNYASGATARNVYQGRQSGANAIVWQGVPIDPPGTNSTRIIRITNIRANAQQLGTSSTLIPTQIVMFVSVTGTTSVPINNPQQTVAFIQPGMTFGLRSVKSTYLQCVSWNKDAATDSTKALADGFGSVVRFTEGFASSFKFRNTATASQSPFNSDVSPAPVRQNDPGAIYNTESGFYMPGATTTNNVHLAGLADHGTRLMARVANVPAGAVLYASVYPVVSSSTPAITAFASAASTVVNGSALNARLVTTDSNGGGAFSATTATSTAGPAPYAPISLSNGSGMATWEVTLADPFLVQTYEFGLAVSYVANASSNLPGLATATVAGSFAPLSTVTTANATAPIPRFGDTSTARTLFTTNACTTNILFVFLTNQAGFDSGIAISNTSADPFGTAPQAGPCKLNYYGETTGGGAAPAAQTSAVVPAGKQLVAVLSTGGNYGISATPGFQGYMIAQCQFQYAHGFAFISDVGASRVSEAYTALILDKGDLAARTSFSSEVLGH